MRTDPLIEALEAAFFEEEPESEVERVHRERMEGDAFMVRAILEHEKCN